MPVCFRLSNRHFGCGFSLYLERIFPMVFHAMRMEVDTAVLERFIVIQASVFSKSLVKDEWWRAHGTYTVMIPWAGHSILCTSASMNTLVQPISSDRHVRVPRESQYGHFFWHTGHQHCCPFVGCATIVNSSFLGQHSQESITIFLMWRRCLIQILLGMSLLLIFSQK